MDGDVARARRGPVAEVDPTGAGDAFDGVLLAGLARGDEPAEASPPRATRAGSSPRAPRTGRRESRRDPFLVADEVALAVASGGRGRARDERDRPGAARAPRTASASIRMCDAIRGGRARSPRGSALVDGAVIVGLEPRQLARFARARRSRRRWRAATVPFAVARGELGATTVSATVWAAATRGDRGRRDRRDRRRAPGPATRRERRPPRARAHPGAAGVLGTEVDRRPGRDGREARGARRGARRLRRRPTAVLPRARDAAWTSSHRVDSPGRGGGARRARSRARRSHGAILLCNPVPAARRDGRRRGVVEATRRAEQRMEAAGVTGKERDAVPARRARRGAPADESSRPTSTCSRTTRGWPARSRSALSASQVWMIDLREVPAVLAGSSASSTSPPARATIVTGTSTIRARWRSASIRISLVQNWSCSSTSGRSRSARAAR